MITEIETPSAPTSDTATRILDCAQQLVQSRGYNAFSFRDLATVVGIKSASIHYYFPTKGDLAEALVVRYREGFNAQLARIERGGSGPRAQLDEYFELIYQSFASNNLICLCGMMATDAASLPPDAQREVRGFFSDNENWLARLLQRGAAEFHFAGAAPVVAASMFAGVQGAMISAYTFGETARLRRALDWLAATLDA